MDRAGVRRAARVVQAPFLMASPAMAAAGRLAADRNGIDAMMMHCDDFAIGWLDRCG